tara:strand:+ start:17 stop:223 length:207 start_codon:yes stop_codon:yes gene_type:complete
MTLTMEDTKYYLKQWKLMMEKGSWDTTGNINMAAYNPDLAIDQGWIEWYDKFKATILTDTDLINLYGR